MSLDAGAVDDLDDFVLRFLAELCVLEPELAVVILKFADGLGVNH